MFVSIIGCLAVFTLLISLVPQIIQCHKTTSVDN